MVGESRVSDEVRLGGGRLGDGARGFDAGALTLRSSARFLITAIEVALARNTRTIPSKRGERRTPPGPPEGPSDGTKTGYGDRLSARSLPRSAANSAILA